MAPGLGPRLRYLIGLIHQDFDPKAGEYEGINLALLAFEEAVDECLPKEVRERRGMGRPRATPSNQVKRLKHQLQWARRAKRKAEEELRRITGGKQGYKNRMTPEFLARAALSKPTTVARGFADAWQDLVGVGVSGCSRTTITRIRDAFAEVVKQHSCDVVSLAASTSAAVRQKQLSAAARQAQSAAVRQVPSFQSVALMHIHDEASLRLRSSADTDLGKPSRSRSSKVQQHAAYVSFTLGQPLRWLTELHPLSDKTARVLATSLNHVLREVAQTVGASLVTSPTPGHAPWLVHILVGDGISTNEAAAKIMWAWVQKEPLAHGARYFIILVKCANHQANLVVASAVTGRAALEAQKNCEALAQSESPFAERPLADRSDSAARSVCGAIVRFFKYLASDYYSDFCANLQEIVGKLRARVPTQERQRQLEAWARLQELYGEGVFPPGLLGCLNAGLGEWAHCLPVSAAGAPVSAARAPADAEGRMEGVRASLLELLRKRVLVVDEQPTLSRMFTFQTHLECFLLLDFLGCAPELVKLRGAQPRERSRKRVVKVLAFLRAPTTPQYLRRTALTLQLVGHVNNMCAQLRDDDSEPLLVRLAKGAVDKAVDKDFLRLLGRLHLDPALETGACVTALLAVAADLSLRFKQYTRWPFAACKLCSKYNEHFLTACLTFLHLPEGELDAAFSLPLRQLAQNFGGTEAQQLQYLASDPVQEALALTFAASAASSLPVERAFAETKRSEAPRLCHVATAGRNQILRLHVRQRRELMAQAEEASAAVRQAMRSSLQSLAWEARPDLIGRPSGARPAPAEATQAHQTAAVREFIAQHKAQLQALLDRRRSDAFAAAAACRRDSPVTQSEWIQRFRENEEDFQEKMANAGKRRRAMNRRLAADAAAPAPASRVGPRSAKMNARSLPRWKQVLWGRCGWHCVVLRQAQHAGAAKEVVTMFLYEHQRRTYLIDLRPWRSGSSYTVDADDGTFMVSQLIQPLADLELEGEVVQVAEIIVSAAARPACVQISAPLARPLSELSKTSKRKLRSDSESEGSVVSEASVSSEEAGAARLREDTKGSSSGSSCPSVDTDADSGVDEVCADTSAAERDELAGPEGAQAQVGVDSGSEGEEQGEDGCCAPLSGAGALRHAPGIWKIWESTWFYATKTPG